MESYTLPLDSQTGKFMSLYLFANVKNSPEIREKLISGELQCCAVKASMVVDPFHLAVAANKAVLREHRRRLTTRSLFTEVLYVMSSSTNISLSLTKFGIHDDDENIVFALIHSEADGAAAAAEQIRSLVDGRSTHFSNISEFTDEALVKKIYKIEDDELAASSLLDSVVSRIGGDYGVSLK